MYAIRSYYELLLPVRLGRALRVREDTGRLGLGRLLRFGDGRFVFAGGLFLRGFNQCRLACLHLLLDRREFAALV